jgi:hypothetical protein
MRIAFRQLLLGGSCNDGPGKTADRHDGGAFTSSSGAFSDSVLMSLAEDELVAKDTRDLADRYKSLY